MSTEAVKPTGSPMEQGIFGPLATEAVRAVGSRGGTPRVHGADRGQAVMSWGPLDDLLPEDHPARQVWAYVQAMDLAALYEPIKAVEGWAGRGVGQLPQHLRFP